MSCPECGHEAETVGAAIIQGHHLGCPNSLAMRARGREVPVSAPQTRGPEGVQGCALKGCGNPRIDHPRAKYCEDHKDPKNRKEQ